MAFASVQVIDGVTTEEFYSERGIVEAFEASVRIAMGVSNRLLNVAVLDVQNSTTSTRTSGRVTSIAIQESLDIDKLSPVRETSPSSSSTSLEEASSIITIPASDADSTLPRLLDEGFKSVDVRFSTSYFLEDLEALFNTTDVVGSYALLTSHYNASIASGRFSSDFQEEMIARNVSLVLALRVEATDFTFGSISTVEITSKPSAQPSLFPSFQPSQVPSVTPSAGNLPLT